ncbi:hypothetical protein LPJ56_000768 [Coemansia sp. RSA 2599]|nr:hypothetical protein LPJ75_000255 [Coemansia sp. RSA 2598]KAJ1828946.1 hypothetical protein LPJ56_000768 [Coemansia sp. RSA 2599]
MVKSQILTAAVSVATQERSTIFIILAAAILLFAVYVKSSLSNKSYVPGNIFGKLTKRHYEFIVATGQITPHSLSSAKKYGPLQYIQPNTVSITDPKDIRQVLSSPKFQKSEYYKIVRFTPTENLMSTRDTDQVSQVRRIFGPYLNTTYLSRMEPLILDCGIKRLMSTWDKAIKENQGNVNYCDSFNLTTFSIITKLVFGREIWHRKNSNDAMDTVQWMSEATNYMSFRALLQVLPSWLIHLITLPWDHYRREVSGYVDDSVKQRQESNTPQPDLLQALVDGLKPQDNKVPLTRDEVIAESFLLLIGGIDPTAFTMLWTLHLLLLYPEHLAKVQDDLRQKFPIGEKDLLVYGDLRNQVPYLEACIYESMRLIPVPCAQLPRTCPYSKVTLQGKEFETGTSVFANIWGSHHSPLNWSDPQRFNPQRFVDDPKAKQSVFAFGYGTRLCMGKHLAMMNMTTILANLLRTYNVRTPPDYKHTGPNVLDANGLPKIMPMTLLLSAKPKYPERDCRLVISRYKEEIVDH